MLGGRGVHFPIRTCATAETKGGKSRVRVQGRGFVVYEGLRIEGVERLGLIGFRV